ncbi:MAG: acyl-CoA ligase (AMP-forming), exosortase A system-associated [Porticoccus sp.]|nr:acyl-CoA ligase (AMP-forming), exosortase A system-associated [Porticoccus sp.]
MSELIHQLITRQAIQTPDATALLFKDDQYSYSELQYQIEAVAHGLMSLGLNPNDRVATYLPKVPQTVFSLFGTTQAGGAFVPINPLLKPKQVAYILDDCDVKVLITSSQRLQVLAETLECCPNLNTVVVVENELPLLEKKSQYQRLSWDEFTSASNNYQSHIRIDSDMAAILYTSGSTGNPKGVVLSHKNMATGAKSVASYLANTQDDRLLAALPFSFDYGLSQLTTAFSVGASVVLMDYLLPRDVIRAIQKYKITGLAAVPPLWNQLAQLEWPMEAAESLRYLTNSGGSMPQATTEKLRAALPGTQVFLMYGLTEAFRSTYLPPDQIDIRPTSMGKAIPNAQVLVVRPDGTECAPGEPGELVHRGSLVAMGYWNDTEKTSQRFKPSPSQPKGIPISEIAVWSGDQVKRDEEGFLYFISRMDDMIKTSGYRVSPSEVEEAIYAIDAIKEAAAIGIPHPTLGQAILLVATVTDNLTPQAILKHSKKELPNFMVPHEIILLDEMPHNQNGKIDRKLLTAEYGDLFQEMKA